VQDDEARNAEGQAIFKTILSTLPERKPAFSPAFLQPAACSRLEQVIYCKGIDEKKSRLYNLIDDSLSLDNGFNTYGHNDKISQNSKIFSKS